MTRLVCTYCLVLWGTGAGGRWAVGQPQTQNPEAAVAAIERLGGEVQRDSALPGGPVVKVTLWATRCTDVDLAHLLAFPELRVLICHGSCKERDTRARITDAGLKYVGQLLKLEEIDLSWHRGVTDAGLAELRRLPALRRFDLSQTGVTPDGRADLQRLITERARR